MKKIYTCIDIGTDTIRILVSEYYGKKFRTLAVSSVRSKGIKRGVIVDESLVLERLKLALDDISSRINIPIKKAVITIPAYNAECTLVHGNVPIVNEEKMVTEKDILRVQNSVVNDILPNMELVSVTPIDFTIYENGSEIETLKDPKNKICDRLGIRAMMVCVPKTSVVSFAKIVEKSGVEVVDLVLSPIADLFEPVELEGTTVSRASVHNVSIVEQLALGVGDHIQVYKANMIIPQIAENMTRSGTLPIPEECPVCHSATAIHEENGVKALFCENASCPAKKIKSFSHFVSRDAMNIDGMSEATIEKLMNQDMIHEPADLFRLDRYKDQIIAMDGFGEKSYEKMVQSATKAAHTTIIRFLYSLGIPNVGLSNAGLICRYCAYDFDRVLAVSEEELTQIDGVGAVIAKAVTDYFAVEANRQVVQHLLQYITLEKIADDNVSKDMEGITFVITGSVERFKNRKELKELIESHGGKVTGSVTSKTNYLINNDAMSLEYRF